MRFTHESRNLFEIAVLGLLLALTGLLLDGAGPAIKHWAVLFLAAAFTSPRKPPAPDSTAWRNWLTRLPWQVGIVSTGLVIFRWWAEMPVVWLLPLGLWPPLTFVLQSQILGKSRALLGPSTKLLVGLQALASAHSEALALLAGEAMILGASLWLGAAYWAVWPAAPLIWCGLPVLWMLVRRLDHSHHICRPAGSDVIHLAGCFALFCTGGFVLGLLTGLRWQGGHLLLPMWTALGLLLQRGWVRRAARTGIAPGFESLRSGLVLVAALWLLRGFATPTLHGTPDALWYGTMLADMVGQTRAGVFPVFLGQTEYQFNGAIYPLRVAPAFHYLGALLDSLTLRTLGGFALQNLLITVIGCLTALAGYLCCNQLTHGRRWVALGFVVLFLSCPGVLGLAYNTDLFMSWTTLPWIVVAFWASVRSFEKADKTTMLALGAATGLLWWGHSPIALWSSLLLGSLQVIRLLLNPGGDRAIPATGAAAVLFGFIAAYPLGSVLFYPPEPGVNSSGFLIADPDALAYFVRLAFPQSVLPLSDLGRQLGDFQLGYALSALWLGGVWWSFRRRGVLAARALLAWTGLFLVLLMPWPGLNFKAWELVPAFIRNATGNWAMNRLYLIWAASIVFATAYLLRRPRPNPAPPAPAKPWLAGVLLVLACMWSVVEAGKFAHGSDLGRRTSEISDNLLSRENVMPTRFAYIVFPHLPSHFSHGVMDPHLLHRLLSPDLTSVLADNYAAAWAAARPVAEAVLRRQSVFEPGSYLSDRVLQLEAGRHYLAQFTFELPPGTPGVVQIKGAGLFREYALHEPGGARAFGQGDQHSNLVALSTSARHSGPVVFRIVTQAPGGPPATAEAARIALKQYEPGALFARVISWVPYRIAVTAPTSGWLETPRMFQNGYVALVDRHPAPVRKTSDGLVAVEVPSGNSVVDLRWAPPAGLLALFWLSFLSITAWLGATLVWIYRRPAA